MVETGFESIYHLFEKPLKEPVKRAQKPTSRSRRLLEKVEPVRMPPDDMQSAKNEGRLTLRQMLDNSKKIFGRRHKQDRSIKITKISPYAGTRWIRFDATSTGEDNKMYNMTLIFYKVDFTDEKDAVHNRKVDITPKGGQQRIIRKWMAPINIAKNPAAAWCSCPDFQYRHEWYLQPKKSLAGGHKRRPYKRKTRTRPSVNPLKLPGVCKHLYQLALKLEASNPPFLVGPTGHGM